MQQLPLSQPLPPGQQKPPPPREHIWSATISNHTPYPRAQTSATVSRLWGWRQPVRNNLIRVIVSLAAHLSAFTLTMPSTNKKLTPAATAEPPSKKRKMDAAEQKYYAVRAGFKPGVYTSWAICQQQITGFKGAQCAFPPLMC